MISMQLQELKILLFMAQRQIEVEIKSCKKEHLQQDYKELMHETTLYETFNTKTDPLLLSRKTNQDSKG